MCQIHDLHLRDTWNCVDGEQPVDGDRRIGFLARFPHRGLFRRLSHLHEAGGQGPVSDSRFDGAAAQHDLALVAHDRTRHDLRIDVVDEAAGGADVTLMRVSGGDFTAEGGGLSLTVHRLSSVEICVRIILTPFRAKSIRHVRHPLFACSVIPEPLVVRGSAGEAPHAVERTARTFADAGMNQNGGARGRRRGV